jgi:aryl-alcohol dehydrogenase-like predicted oxidoreductase
VSEALLILGTAQLGGAYGIANRIGELDAQQAGILVETALRLGITRFDTAKAYLGSERTLGSIFTALGAKPRVHVSTKGSIAGIDAPSLTSAVEDSLSALQIEHLDHWLMHNENEVELWSSAFDEEAIRLKNNRSVRSFGVSVYHPDSAIAALQSGCLDSIQCPASPLDRRFLRCGALHDLAKNGKQIILRSVFLQGLCLLQVDEVPPGIKGGAEAVEALDEFCQRHCVERDRFCLHYVLHRSQGLASGLVVGSEAPDQLRRNVFIAQSDPLPFELFEEWDRFWPQDVEDLVLPSRWNLRDK